MQAGERGEALRPVVRNDPLPPVPAAAPRPRPRSSAPVPVVAGPGPAGAAQRQQRNTGPRPRPARRRRLIVAGERVGGVDERVAPVRAQPRGEPVGARRSRRSAPRRAAARVGAPGRPARWSRRRRRRRPVSAAASARASAVPPRIRTCTHRSRREGRVLGRLAPPASGHASRADAVPNSSTPGCARLDDRRLRDGGDQGRLHRAADRRVPRPGGDHAAQGPAAGVRAGGGGARRRRGDGRHRQGRGRRPGRHARRADPRRRSGAGEPGSGVVFRAGPGRRHGDQARACRWPSASRPSTRCRGN